MTDAPATCDILFRDATIVDGTGAPGRRGDVAVTGDRISGVGDLAATTAGEEIAATGKVVAPGFIDVHTHDDRALITDPDMTPKLSQGVTTVVPGNCGFSLAPLLPEHAKDPVFELMGGPDAFLYPTFGSYLDALDAAPAAINAAPLVGHATLRAGAMDTMDRAATEDEIAAMRAKVGEALESGAAGFSSGLFYPPGRQAPAAELVALIEPLAGTGAVYTTHMRNEDDHVEDSLEETFETARQAGVPVVISHHKCAGVTNHGRSTATLGRIEKARQGQAIGLDAYPYTAGSTVLMNELVERAERTIITWSNTVTEAAGRDLAELAAEWGVEILEAADRVQPAGAVYFMLSEEDVQSILSYSRTMIGSDGIPHDKHPHPRLWGTFPRVLGHYSRELGLFTLEEAVHRMSGLSAETFGIKDRGRVAAGCFADLVLFDPETVIDRATYEQPERPAAGIDMVLVNGSVAYAAGKWTGSRSGRTIRRAA
ncbi:MAG: D-aminoacylase [Alphaproteobacteria bacterium]|jgi:N-acyl-D-amino-acid deacylase|nr:D-aminoacylase [Alphaproteobacteria bacterium]HJP23023.1 D-aminoacylase [Alphaproteobacteria bacterium]